MKKARTLFCSTRSQTHSPSESYARWRTLEPLGFARRQRPPCKRDADPSGLKADREGDYVANVLGWLRMRLTKTYWHRKTARSEFRAEPQQPGPAYGACPCRNLHHCRQSRTSQHGSLFRRCSIVFGPQPTFIEQAVAVMQHRQSSLSHAPTGSPRIVTDQEFAPRCLAPSLQFRTTLKITLMVRNETTVITSIARDAVLSSPELRARIG